MVKVLNPMKRDKARENEYVIKFCRVFFCTGVCYTWSLNAATGFKTLKLAKQAAKAWFNDGTVVGRRRDFR